MMLPRFCRFSFLTILCSVALFLGENTCWGQSLYISEVMPDNNGILLDEEGEASDWVELYNASAAAVDLGGWFLTDDAADLQKWSFPSTNLAAGAFLTVFASGKARAVAGAELHTNFKLKAGGEYIALVRPEGSLEDGFEFPALEKGASFGRPFEGALEEVLIDSGTACRVFVPTNAALETVWFEPAFDDAAWKKGPLGVGYEARSGYENLIQTSLLDMRFRNKSAYVRVPFVVEHPAAATGLQLELMYDDGFMAFLNGEWVVEDNTEGTRAWDSGSSGVRSEQLASAYETFDLSASLDSLQPGTNWLAFQVLNDLVDLQDLLLLPRLTLRTAAGISSAAPGVLETATPNGPNATSPFVDVVESPSVYPERGFYEEPIAVMVSCATTGAVVRYTLDGSEPTTNSLLYAEPIPVDETTCLRVRGFRDGWRPSFSRTDSYLFLEDVVVQPQEEYAIKGQNVVVGMDADVVSGSYQDASNQPFSVFDALEAIPTLSITTDERNLFDPDTGIYVNAYERWERPASLELIYADGSEGFQVNAGLRIRGGYSRKSTNPKHSFRFFFRNEYGAGKLKYPLFDDEGVDEFDKMDLRTAQNYSWGWNKDIRNTLLRDVICRDAMADMDEPYTRSRYYHVYLNGLYWGIYMTEERPEARFAASYLGGDAEDYDTMKRKSSKAGVEATDGNLLGYERLFEATMAGYTNNADYFAVQGLDEAGARDASLERLVDLQNMIDYLLVIYYSGASDNGITWFYRNASINNLYTVFNRTHPDGFKWLQHDCEHGFDTSTDYDRTGPFEHENYRYLEHFNAQTLHQALCANPEYRLAFADRVYKHFTDGGALVQQEWEKRLDARTAQLDRAIVAHAARWGNAQLNRDCWVNAAAKIRHWFSGRCETVMGYLQQDGLLPSVEPPMADVASGLVAAGTSVSLSAEEGTVYYTLDGSDPRAMGGAVQGQLYEGAIAVTQPTVLRARVQAADGEWSAQRERVFWTAAQPLAITEVMYHAASNALDFVEIQNVADETVELANYALAGGIEFAFSSQTLAPGAFAVVASDVAAFTAAYPAQADLVAGAYVGELDNAGEKIKLKFSGETLISFSYSDARNWPQAADGGGHSLVPRVTAPGVQATGLLNCAENWCASAYRMGSPGAADPDLASSVVINEVVAHTDEDEPPPFDSNDRIELYNASEAAVDLSGWTLGDGWDAESAWTIPAGTTMEPNSFLVFDENDFHPGRTNGFGLNKAGEMVVLAAADRVVDVIRFKGQENEVAYGRYPDGADQWCAMVPTTGSANDAGFPDVALMQVMYASPGDDDLLEFVVLQNTTESAITFATEAGAWRLAGGINYTFDPAFSLPANRSVWMVPFDPADSASLATFCAAYGLVAENEYILGPYGGKLDNEGERVALERPQLSDDPLKPFDLSWVVVDELFYSCHAPWPEAAATEGLPLARIDLFEWDTPVIAIDF